MNHRTIRPGLFLQRAIAALWLAVAGLSPLMAELPKAANGLGITMYQVPAGSFTMGNNNGRYDEKPQRTVTLASFYLSKTEVTYDQWMKVYSWALGKGYVFDGYFAETMKMAYRVNGSCPVTMVNWFDCVKWCNAASEMEKRTPCYVIGTAVYKSGENNGVTCKWDVNGFRLPTEAEWEYACRARSTSAYSWGSSIDDRYAWHGANSTNMTHPVGLKKGNAWDFLDMSGNVHEWCWDLYQSYAGMTGSNPKGAASGTYRVSRGGAYNLSSYYLNPEYRFWLLPVCRVTYIGLRLASSR